jgi:hypothetical protein
MEESFCIFGNLLTAHEKFTCTANGCARKQAMPIETELKVDPGSAALWRIKIQRRKYLGNTRLGELKGA